VIFYEHEAKQLLRMAGLTVPGSILVSDQSSMHQREPRLPAVVKVQTPFGKRLEQGGIRFVQSERQLELALSDLLGADFKGFRVEHVLIEEQIRYGQEWFVSLGYDALLRSPVLLLSPHGGSDIEGLALTQPDAVWKMALTPQREILPHHLIGWLSERGLRGNQLRDFSQLLRNLIRYFFEWDALLLEINPLAQTQEGKYFALDCHLEVDDDALHRQRFEILLGRKLSPGKTGERSQTAFESRAQEIDETDYRGVAGRLIEFPGNLGLLIGGGGASLTIFDAILCHNGEPANYCEIGGNPTAEKVAKLAELIVAQPKVEKLAVIMNVVNNTQADLVAEGVIRGIRAAGKVPQDVIVMFRLPGSGEGRCREILNSHNVSFTDRSVTIDEAALRAVEAVRAVKGTDVRK
jgi:succinyl-CoA synthetase beta subunit